MTAVRSPKRIAPAVAAPPSRPCRSSASRIRAACCGICGPIIPLRRHSAAKYALVAEPFGELGGAREDRSWV